MDKKIIEICCNSLTSALNAQKAGADRIELCANLDIGGTTPSYGTLKLVREKLTIPINVLIRPRGGDFLYNKNEIEEIFEDIKICKSLGVNGIVCGFLDKDGNIDISLTKKAVNASKPLSFTFHRAFDLSKDYINSLEDIILCGADRILTSGLANKVTSGIEIIKDLVEKANNRIIIMPGSGINSNNIKEISEYTKVNEIHMSGTKFHHSKMNFKREYILSDNEDYTLMYSDVNNIKDAIKNFKQ